MDVSRAFARSAPLSPIHHVTGNPNAWIAAYACFWLTVPQDCAGLSCIWLTAGVWEIMKNSLGTRLIAGYRRLRVSGSLGNEGYFTDQAKKKTTLISMIRNESEIMETFSGHALALFDRVIFIDHLSTDGTGEYIALLSEKHPKVEYYCFDEPGYYQSDLMTWATKTLVDNQKPGWVFFLDADEFLPFESKEAFDRKLSEFASFPVISMPWLNLVPLDMKSGRVIDQLFLKPAQASNHRKVAFQPNRMPLDNYFIAQGNHAVYIGNRSLKIKMPAERSFSIYHVPIRTKQQLREKILCGVESYQRMGTDRRQKNGFHWDQIHRIMVDTDLTTEMMAGIAAQYSDTLQPPYERSIDELRKDGYKELRLEVGFLKPAVSFADVPTSHADNNIRTGGGLSADASKDVVAPHRRIRFDRWSRSMQIIE